MKQEDLKHLFKNLKNGDSIGFYAKPWYLLFARLIFWVTHIKLSHVANVFDVKRRGVTLSFSVGEQTISHKGKTVERYTMINSLNGILIDSRFRNTRNIFYYMPLKFRISKDQNKILKEYWNTKEDYAIEELAYTVNWFFKIFGNKNKVYDGNCSTACRQAMILAGVKADNDDKAPTPAEFSKFSYIKDIIKIV
tara:strand:- start:148 stop:729 length:582 start_codon:yes stop_codon:yes gene_type:complete